MPDQLPRIRVRRSLPPGAVRRPLTGDDDRDDHGAPRPAPAHPAGAGAVQLGAGPADRPGAGAQPGGRGRPGVTAGPGGGPGPGWSGGATRVAGPRPGGRRVPVAASVLAAVAIVVAVVAATGLVSGGGSGSAAPTTDRPPGPRAGSDGGPPVLQLREEAMTERAAGPPTPAGPLPEGPATGQVRDLPAGAATEQDVIALAAALGVPGRPGRAMESWVVGGLKVSDAAGHPWQLRTDAADPPVVAFPDEPDRPVSGPADDGGTPPRLRDVLRVAPPVLAALGLDGAATRISASGGSVDVIAEPLVDGLPTSGVGTRLRYDAGVRLVGAAGWLTGAPGHGATYPLVTAEQALAAMPAGPEIALGCGAPGDPGCRRTVSDAEPGLVLRHDRAGAALLVPAWLFTIGNRNAPKLAVVAVDPEFLATTADPAPAGSSVPPGPDDSAATQDGSTGDPGPGGTPAPPRNTP